MSRIIDADALIAEIIECKRSFLASPNSVSLHDLECDGAISWIDGATTIDAVPVVRCRDCKHWVKFGVSEVGETDKVKACELAIWTVGENGHCICGERKDGAE